MDEIETESGLFPRSSAHFQNKLESLEDTSTAMVKITIFNPNCPCAEEEAVTWLLADLASHSALVSQQVDTSTAAVREIIIIMNI